MVLDVGRFGGDVLFMSYLYFVTRHVDRDDPN
jgi:hypothetical protein